jgi:hypothetical protein
MEATSRTRARIGMGLSALPVLFLVFDGIIKLLNIQPVQESFVMLGIPSELAATIGILELTCVALYVVPRTAVLGAVLLTGYLGGAVAIHMRHLDPLFSHTIFPLYVGLPLWAGIVLRDERVRVIFTSIFGIGERSSKKAHGVSIPDVAG